MLIWLKTYRHPNWYHDSSYLTIASSALFVWNDRKSIILKTELWISCISSIWMRIFNRSRVYAIFIMAGFTELNQMAMFFFQLFLFSIFRKMRWALSWTLSKNGNVFSSHAAYDGLALGFTFELATCFFCSSIICFLSFSWLSLQFDSTFVFEEMKQIWPSELGSLE